MPELHGDGASYFHKIIWAPSLYHVAHFSVIDVELFGDLRNLPLFNPDIEATQLAVVARFRERLIAADAVIIASPEYAHGVTGSIKNALDWMVGCEAFVNKPVALLNASPRAHTQHSRRPSR